MKEYKETTLNFLSMELFQFVHQEIPEILEIYLHAYEHLFEKLESGNKTSADFDYEAHNMLGHLSEHIELKIKELQQKITERVDRLGEKNAANCT